MRHQKILKAAAGVSIITSGAWAQHYVEYGVNLSLGPDYIEHYEQGALPVGPITHEDVIDGYGRVAAEANVGFGVNKARVDLAGTNPANPLWFEYGFATSRYWDTFQFDDPALNGTQGFFEVTLFVAGSGFVTLSDEYLQSLDTEFDAFWHAVINVSVDGVTDPWGSPIQSVYYAGEWYKGYESTTLDYYGDTLDTYQQTGTIEFIFGQPIFVDTFLQVDTFFDNQTSSMPGMLDSVIDLGNSSYWGGIRNLRDSQGHPVSPAGYSSSSGFDYRQTAAPAPVPPALTAADSGIARNRYLSVLTPTQAGSTALRVTLTSLMHPDPPNLPESPAPDFTAFESQVRWVGPVRNCVESEAPPTTFKCAALQCSPYYTDWFAALGGQALHLSGIEVVPSSAYDVVQVAATCQGSEDTCTAVSEPIRMYTARWGDIVSPFQAPAPAALTQPDIVDVAAVVDKLLSLSTASAVARCDLHPPVPDFKTDIRDVSSAVDALKGAAYPDSALTACP